MTQLAEEFVQPVRHRHNSLRCLLFYENLSAHVAKKSKRVFYKGNEFLCFYPDQTTESTQPIDAGCCRSIRCT